MTASTRRELRSAATSTSTTAIGLIRALTDARPIEPTSTRCLSARRPNPAEAPLIDAEILFRQPQPPHLFICAKDLFFGATVVMEGWRHAPLLALSWNIDLSRRMNEPVTLCFSCGHAGLVLGSFCISSLPKNMKSAFSHENHILLLRPLRLGNPNRARR